MVRPRLTHPDPRLQDVLSARQYISADQGDSVEPELEPTPPIASKTGHETTISSSTGQSAESSPTEKADQTTAPDAMAKSRSRLHVRRSTGRPRLDPKTGGGILSEDRRDQIRRAQRTYRLKKEATLEKAKERVTELEDKLNKVAAAIADYKAAFPSDVKTNHPALSRHLDCLSNFITPGSEPTPHRTSSVDSENDILSPQHNVVSNDPTCSSTSPIDCDCLENYRNRKQIEPPIGMVKKRPRLDALSEELENKGIRRSVRFQEIGQLTQKDVHYTYSLAVTPLLSGDKSKMYPYFQRLVSAGTKDALELPTLPFYAIGGAGTHYPRQDGMGNPVYPSNTRLPKRVLGVFQAIGAMTASGQGSNQQNYLELCGYGGEWFDCRDVEGYLREKGVDLDGSCLFPSIHNPRVHRISQSTESQGLSEAEQDFQLVSDGSRSSSTREGTEVSKRLERFQRKFFDVEQFLSKLLSGVVILGRVPGFRQTDVAAAFKSALRVQGQ
ncbi:hypothetical protein BBP40_004173 [Aspergillus hancockii]|nr:hypothetical protein BBP40_004173 [Aspergillus hancockii]